MPKVQNTIYIPYHQDTKTTTKFTKGDHTITSTSSLSHIVGDQSNKVILTQPHYQKQERNINTRKNIKYSELKHHKSSQFQYTHKTLNSPAKPI